MSRDPSRDRLTIHHDSRRHSTGSDCPQASDLGKAIGLTHVDKVSQRAPPNPLTLDCGALVDCVRAQMQPLFPAELAGKCAETIRAHAIQGPQLPHLSREDWAELIPELGPRCYLTRLVSEWQQQQQPQRPSSGPSTLPPPGADVDADHQPMLTLPQCWRPDDSDQPWNDLDEAKHRLPPYLCGLSRLHPFVMTPFNHCPLVNEKWVGHPREPCCMKLGRRALYHVLDFLFIICTLVFEVMYWYALLGVTCLAIWLWCCTHFNLAVNYNPSVLITAVIFPITFSVHAAYARREQSLRSMATFKGAILFILLYHGTWAPLIGPQKKHYVRWGGRRYVRRTVALLRGVQHNLQHYFCDLPAEDRVAVMKHTYILYGELCHHNEVLTEVGVSPPLVSQVLGALGRLMEAFESLRSARDYHTPSTVKCYMHFGVFIVSAAFGPYWAYIINSNPGTYRTIATYLFAIILYLLLQLLISLQHRLESPFEEDQDDIASSTYQLFKIFSQSDREEILDAVLRRADSVQVG